MEGKGISVAVIGCGYWGKNLIRNFYELEALKVLYDIDEGRAREIGSLYPHVRIARNLTEIYQDPSIRGVVVATPA